jgi:predicted nuclease of predicted toxin-antitoxin system
LARLKIYTDENVDVRVAEGLKRRGVHAFSALEKKMTGASDREHLRFAAENQAVFFTHDHHLLEIATALTTEGKNHWGVIFVEMDKLTVGECIKRLALYAELLTAEEMKNVVEFL